MIKRCASGDRYAPAGIAGSSRSCGARYPEPAHVELYRTLIHGPLQFGQDENSLQIAAPWIDLPSRLPDSITHAMARELALHPRTLRRRLEAEGASYRDILAGVRRGLAIEYLRKTRMTTEEIASRLGYRDAATFRHAFARWTGQGLPDFRQR